MDTIGVTIENTPGMPRLSKGGSDGSKGFLCRWIGNPARFNGQQ